MASKIQKRAARKPSKSRSLLPSGVATVRLCWEPTQASRHTDKASRGTRQAKECKMQAARKPERKSEYWSPAESPL